MKQKNNFRFKKIFLNCFLVWLVIFAIDLNAKAIEQPIDLGVYGQTYKIVEEDWWKLLQEKLRKFQKDGNISQRLEEIAKKSQKVDLGLPLCKQDRIFEKEIKYIVPQDIIWQGRVLYKKGYELNVLKRVPLTGHIIIANYETKEDKKILMDTISETLNEDNNNKLRVLITKGNIKEFQEKVQDTFTNNILVSKMTKMLVDKFNISCVPVVISQKNYKLQILEVSNQ